MSHHFSLITSESKKPRQIAVVIQAAAIFFGFFDSDVTYTSSNVPWSCRILFLNQDAAYIFWAYFFALFNASGLKSLAYPSKLNFDAPLYSHRTESIVGWPSCKKASLFELCQHRERPLEPGGTRGQIPPPVLAELEANPIPSKNLLLLLITKLPP